MVQRPIDSLEQTDQDRLRQESIAALTKAEKKLGEVQKERLLEEQGNRQRQANFKAESKKCQFDAKMARRQAENLEGGKAFLKWLDERVFPESYQGYDNLLALLMKQFAISEQFGKAFKFSYIDTIKQGLHALGLNVRANQVPTPEPGELPKLKVQFIPILTADGQLGLKGIRTSDNHIFRTSDNHIEGEEINFLDQITTAWLLKNGYHIDTADQYKIKNPDGDVITAVEFEALRVDPVHGLDAFIQSLPDRLHDIALEQHQTQAPNP